MEEYDNIFSLDTPEWNEVELDVEDAGNRFDGYNKSKYCIIGHEFTELEDGEVVEIPEPDDEYIMKQLGKLGFDISKGLKTYVQYLSTDNI